MLIDTQKTRGIYMWANYQVPEQNDTASTTSLNSKIMDLTKQLSPFTSGPTIDPAGLPIVGQLRSTQQQRNTLLSSGSGTTTVMRDTASPAVSLSGVTRIDIKWENTIGNRQGLKANFLQPWFNKPVSITIEGESYMGAWGGKSVSESISSANAANAKQSGQASTIAKVKNAVNSAVNTAVRKVQDKVDYITNLIKSAGQQTIGPFTDQTVSNVQQLISFFPWGPSGSPDKKAVNIKFGLLIENETTGYTKDSYAVFEGFITSFHYNESIEKPYIYTYTIEFIGQSQQDATIGGQVIVARTELSKMGVTTAVAAGSQAITLFTLG